MADRTESAFEFYFRQPTNELLPIQANFEEADRGVLKVGSYESDPLGLFDMHGNVWEWCDDRTQSGLDAMLRGGGWKSDGILGRASYVAQALKGYRASDLGLRLARVPSTDADSSAPAAETVVD